MSDTPETDADRQFNRGTSLANAHLDRAYLELENACINYQLERNALREELARARAALRDARGQMYPQCEFEWAGKHAQALREANGR